MKLLPKLQALAVTGVWVLCTVTSSADPERQADVAARGAQVMPGPDAMEGHSHGGNPTARQ